MVIIFDRIVVIFFGFVKRISNYEDHNSVLTTIEIQISFFLLNTLQMINGFRPLRRVKVMMKKKQRIVVMRRKDKANDRRNLAKHLGK